METVKPKDEGQLFKTLNAGAFRQVAVTRTIKAYEQFCFDFPIVNEKPKQKKKNLPK